ncbi:MAG: DUF3341 domain-containing protein [Deltaproteobacteria bacterium]|nr:DUF3341 domain-containing protein [Deltaproteobacteria bacterium]
MAALLAEFNTADALLAAVRKLRETGYSELDTFSPFPLHGGDEALGLRPSRLPYYVLAGGAVGATGAYALQWWMNAYNYPINVGGRPPHMPAAFFFVTFEMGVLFAALSALVTLLLLAGLPRLWHPVFEVDGFERATIDRFWLSVSSRDARFDAEKTRHDLERMGALRIILVESEG